MSDNDLIRRGDARDILSEEGWLGRSFERIASLPAVTQPSPDAAAIREAALREAAKEAEYFASRDLELQLTRADGTLVQRLTPEQAMREVRNVAAHISQRILALITEKPHDRA